VSRGRKVKRHACHVIGTCRKDGTERSCADAPPERGPENIEAARERETNASEPLAAPGAAGRWETKEPCPMETAKSMGAQETNVPEERSAAVRRDGEQSDGLKQARAVGNAADVNRDGDVRRGARGHHGNPPAVRIGASAAFRGTLGRCGGAS
jgi:hypothetical protein